MRLFVLGICVVGLAIGCFKTPAELNGQKAADCSSPTYPKNISIDPDSVVVVVEIYDYMQQLVKYMEITNPPRVEYLMETESFSQLLYPYIFTISWDKTDMSGKGNLSPGIYLGKATIFAHGKIEWGCDEIAY